MPRPTSLANPPVTANATNEAPVRLEATNKTPHTGIAMDAYPFSLYKQLGFTLTSVELVAEVSKTTGEVKKAYRPIGKWQSEATRILREGTHYAMLTGTKSGATAIDIDDPNAEHNKELMDLMTECNMVAKTNKGYHYLYAYNPKVKTTASKKLALDTRNDEAILFVAPTRLEHKGKIVANYEWIKTPMDDDEPLTEIPEDVLKYLYTLDQRYVELEPQNVVESDEEEEADTTTTVSVAEAPKTDDEHELVKVLDALSPTRYAEYDDWLKIGLALYNEKLGVDVWERLSKKYYPRMATGDSKRDCRSKWAGFGKHRKDKQITSATLWHMLKKDNPAKFYELMETRQDFLAMLTLLNSNDIAKYFYNISPDKYVYNEHMGWYSLTANNTWSHSEKPVPSGVKGDIANTFQTLCLDTKRSILAKHAREAGATADKEKHKQLEEQLKPKIDLIHKSYKQLGGADFCSGVISFLDTYYNNEELEATMDTNPYLFAFSDGVYDLNECKFRPITPADMISTTTGYAYPKASNPKVRKEIEAFIYGLFEDNDTKDYLLKVLASCLLGYNKFERYYVFTGAGGNGKGVITELIRVAFGNYYIPVNVSLFTKIQERLDMPVPALVESRNRRFMMSSEPETSEKLQVSMLKKISGGDPMEARTLHSKHVWKFKPMFKPFFQANDIPKLSKVDTAIQRRMEVIKFPFNFVANPTLPHERKGDPDVKNIKCVSDEWRDEFILMLTEIYAKDLKNAKTIALPDSVKASTNDYIDDNNPLKFWLNDKYEVTKSDHDTIRASELKADYMRDMKVEKCDDRWFKQLLSFNGINHKRTGTGAVYTGLRRKADLEMEE